MASLFRSGSSRRKAEAPGKIRIQLKGKNSKVLNSEDEDEVADDDSGAMDGDNGIPEDLPEGTIVVQPVAVEDIPVKKKRDPPVRIDTSVLDSVSCTACGRQLNPYKSGALQKHPELKVVICKRCDKFLNSGDIAKDKDGTDEQCRWCGEGGRLVVCDECASAFCKTCVMRNFNRSEFNNINSQQKWKCYLCNKAPLQGLRENYKKIKETLKALHLRDKAKAAAAAPTSNGTQNSEKSVGSKQISEGSAPKGKSVQSTNIPSVQAKNASSASSSVKSNSKASNAVQDKTVDDFTLRLEDINVSHENVDTVMEKLSTATNTFKEMLRALRSQFHATSPRGSDEASPMIQFSLNSMNVQEKKRRCAKALNMGLETYVKSLKTILSGSAVAGDTKSKDDKTDNNKSEEDKIASKGQNSTTSLAFSKTVNSVAKSKETNVNGLKDSTEPNSHPSRQAFSRLSTTKQGKKNATENSSDDESSESSNSEAEDSPKDKSPRGKKTEKLKSSSKHVEKLAKDKTKTSVENSPEKSSSKSASTKDSIGASTDKEKDKTTSESVEVADNKTKESYSANSGDSINFRDKVKDKADSEGNASSVKSGKKDVVMKDNAKTVSKDSVNNKDSGKDNTEEPQKSVEVDSEKKNNNSKVMDNGDTVDEAEAEQSKNDPVDFKSNKSSNSGTELEKDKSQEEEDDPKAANSQGSDLLKESQTDRDSSKSFIAADETDENLAAKFDLIKELADEMLKGNRDEEEDDNEVEDDDVQDGDDTAEAAEISKATKKFDKQGRSKRKKDLSSDSDDKDASATAAKKSKSGKKVSKKAREEKAAKSTKYAAVSSSDVSSSDLLMSDASDDNTTARRQRKKRKDTPKSTEPMSNKPAKPKSEPVKKEEKSQANGKPKAKSTTASVKVNGEKSKVDVDDLDKEIDKLAKMPTIRKRKAGSTDEDKDTVEKEEMKGKSKGANQASKKSKPGPKCSKKATDYDGLSSEEDNKASEHDYDDDDDDNDLPPVQFFLEETSPKEDKDMEEDEENEMAKNGLLEDIKDEVDNDDDDDDKDDDDDDSSSDEDSETSKSKSKKKNAKRGGKAKVKEGGEDAENKDGDSDEDIGKRKQIRSKLLDTKLSDSDSDVGKPKKRKKGSDNESFNDKESSSGSSIESDLTDDDEEEESEKDSEDMENDDGEPKPKKKGKKRRRRKKGKKGSDDNEEDEDGEGGKKKKKGKGKRRRRIKKMNNSSDEDGEENEDDDDDPNSSKAGKRKQIRKVMSNKKLEDSTKAAAKAEEKRRKRIAAKQREFNIETITDENNPMNCPITTKLVLEPGKEEGDDPVIQVNKSLIRKLKPHQVEAVQFMWDCMYESVKRSKKESGAGCILAHCMGLGKTLSVISFVHTILTHEKILKHRTCLVVSPLNTVLNWRNEWTMWLDEEDQLEVWELASCKQNAARADALKDWHESGGIMIMGYEMYRNLTTGNRCKNKRQKKRFQETLVDPGPDLVICDEGHILKNEASAISKAMNQMKTRRRVVLTGTPLQNNLNEYHCMVSFVKPNLLGTRKEFTNRFISPIQNGQCTDSTPRDVKLMKARAHVLHEMLAGCVQRRDYSALTKFLPPKQEYVISVRLTNIQIELYEKYLEMSGQGIDGVFTNKGARLFTDYQNLMKIWTHPWVLKLAEIRDEMKVKYDDEDSFIDDDSEGERSFSTSSSSSEEEKAGSDSGGEGTSAGPSMKRGTRRTRAKARRQAGEDSDPEEVIAEWKSKTRNKEEEEDVTMEETDKSVTKEWWAPYVTEDDKLKQELSNKLVLLFEILRMCEEIGDKVLIFSQSILSLNIIESFLEVIDSKFQQDCDNAEEDAEMNEKETFGRSWTKNLDYYRMDGTTSAQNRQLWAASFNDLENYRARLFLISTRAGGLGINLVAANRVIIFDASWNPSHDVQSIFRVYRFGQTKPCYIYRFLAQGTMEEKIYERQVTKLSLSQRVVDEHQIERHFSANDLKELYNFRPDRWDDGTEKPTLSLPKDPLLAEILTANKHCVVSFHEHDSLLENQVEQTLTEEEKKAAWEEYENEKKGIIVRGPGMERTASWPMMAAAQILSREQITATVQALRQQLPDVSEELFHMHVQQALRRQVQMKQEEMRRMELLRLQEMNYLNMIKQQAEQSGLSHAQSMQAMQNMAPWMQMQRLRAMQNSMMMQGMHPSSSMSLLGQAPSNLGERLSNKPEDAIDLDDN